MSFCFEYTSKDILKLSKLAIVSYLYASLLDSSRYRFVLANTAPVFSNSGIRLEDEAVEDGCSSWCIEDRPVPRRDQVL